MDTAALVFAQIPGWCVAGIALQTNALLLVAGLGLLGGTLLILLFKRWGRGRPLAKCVALSVFAHLLLLASACSVQLFPDLPVRGPESIIHLTVVDAGAEPQQAVPSQPDKPPLEEPAEPIAEAKPQSETGSDQVPQPPRMPDLTPQTIAPPPLAAAAVTDAAPSEPPHLLPGDPLDTPLPAAPALSPSSPIAEQLAKPALPEPQRLSVAELTPAPTIRVTDQPAGKLAAEQDELQRLIDMALPLPSPTALTGSQDRLQAADAALDEIKESSTADAPVVSATPSSVDRGTLASSSGEATWKLAPPQPISEAGELPDAYRSRSAAQRAAALAMGGGNGMTEAAVRAALQWLAANQNEDGRWDCSRHGGGRETKTLGHDRGGAGGEADTAVTGLAVLAFLGAGHTHRGGKHATTVRRGLEFLARRQAADGNLAGNAELFARMYCHGMATLALGEAYGMTGDPGLRPFLEQALGYTIRSQHPVTGGWRYQPGDEGDTSQLGWQLMSLHSAELAGLPVPAATRAGMIRFLNTVTTGPQRGLASYRPRTAPSRTMTAEALVCRAFLGWKQDESALREAVAYLLQETPQGGPFNEYYWYYATLALFQVQGPAWEAWNSALQDRLLATQETNGTLAGSWPSDTIWGGYGGRVYTTAMNAMCLEVYYRHLPVYGQTQLVQDRKPE